MAPGEEDTAKGDHWAPVRGLWVWLCTLSTPGHTFLQAREGVTPQQGQAVL